MWETLQQKLEQKQVISWNNLKDKD